MCEAACVWATSNTWPYVLKCTVGRGRRKANRWEYTCQLGLIRRCLARHCWPHFEQVNVGGGERMWLLAGVALLREEETIAYLTQTWSYTDWLYESRHCGTAVGKNDKANSELGNTAWKRAMRQFNSLAVKVPVEHCWLDSWWIPVRQQLLRDYTCLSS
jgi:hypothetical protein